MDNDKLIEHMLGQKVVQPVSALSVSQLVGTMSEATDSAWDRHNDYALKVEATQGITPERKSALIEADRLRTQAFVDVVTKLISSVTPKK